MALITQITVPNDPYFSYSNTRAPFATFVALASMIEAFASPKATLPIALCTASIVTGSFYIVYACACKTLSKIGHVAVSQAHMPENRNRLSHVVQVITLEGEQVMKIPLVQFGFYGAVFCISNIFSHHLLMFVF